MGVAVFGAQPASAALRPLLLPLHLSRFSLSFLSAAAAGGGKARLPRAPGGSGLRDAQPSLPHLRVCLQPQDDARPHRFLEMETVSAVYILALLARSEGVVEDRASPIRTLLAAQLSFAPPDPPLSSLLLLSAGEGWRAAKRRRRGGVLKESSAHSDLCSLPGRATSVALQAEFKGQIRQRLPFRAICSPAAPQPLPPPSPLFPTRPTSITAPLTPLPSHSLRTLSRALEYSRVAMPVYGLQRSLLDGLSMTFLTLLSSATAPTVEALIAQHVLKGTRPSELLRAPPPPPGSTQPSHALFEQYWVEAGGEPLPDAEAEDHFVLTPSVRRHLATLARAVLLRRHPILLQVRCCF